MSQSRLDRLGLAPQLVTTEQIGVIESLTEAEFELLVTVKERLDAVGDDVVGHSLNGGGLVW